MCEDLSEINTRNIVKPMIDPLPENIHQILEELKKKPNEEDLHKYSQALKSD